MLKENWLKWLALAIGLTGLILVYIFTTIDKPVFKKVSTLSKKNIGEFVSLRGKIENVFLKKENLFFEINDGQKIKIVFFKATNKQILKAKKNSFKTVIGKVEKYKGELEIIGREIND